LRKAAQLQREKDQLANFIGAHSEPQLQSGA
jgi:hypothetical protein